MKHRWTSTLPLILASSFLAAQATQVDATACRGMFEVLMAMRGGASRGEVAARLDRLLATRPYQVMFQHYNRSWRPNHLPPEAFKRMILGLGFPDAYTPGENGRADQMRVRWQAFYPDLENFERQLRQLEAADLPALIRAGVAYAQSWLPQGWTIPDFYCPIVPNGGSPAFALDQAQGYDFLQVPRKADGALDLDWLVGTIAHESHHLGLAKAQPRFTDARQGLAYEVATMCLFEGSATAFISGPPPGRAPVVPGVKFHVFTQDLAAAWRAKLGEEEAMVRRQSELLAKAEAGNLSQAALDEEMRSYWLDGLVGRAYVLGADMFAAIFLAFGKAGVLEVLADPRVFLARYNAALAAQPEALRKCPAFPDAAVRAATAIGR